MSVHTIVSWAPGTQVTLCNVPWNSDYRDIVKFASNAALDSYIMNNAGPTIPITRMTYAKPGMPVKISVPFNTAYKFNYLRVHNTAPNDIPRTFYYFIQDVEYGSPDTTILHVQLDVWQTFNRDVSFGNCYIERGHIGVANANQMVNNGREYLTVPEGLDLGGEYLVEKIGRSDVGSIGSGVAAYDVIVATTISFQYSGGDAANPVINSATGSMFQGMPNGVELYYFSNATEYTQFMGMIGSKPWVSQGIIAVYACPNLGLSEGSVEEVECLAINGTKLKKLVGGKVVPQMRVPLTNWRDGLKGTTGRYRHLKKFLTYPYRVVELTTYSGNPLVLKPESMYGSNVTVMELDYVALPGPRIAFYPYKYNSGGVADEVVDGAIVNDGAEFLDMTTGITDLPMFSVVNNGYMSFLASNKNTIAYQHRSADWSQQKALAANTLAYDNATSGMNSDIMSTNFSNQAAYDTMNLANDTAMLQAATGAVGSIGGGVAGGPAGVAAGAGSAAMSGINTAIGMQQRSQQAAISTGLATKQLGARLDSSMAQRDRNKDYADFAARGDYENQIASINARVQDATMIQPTTSGQLGGDAFNLAVYRWAIHAKVKVIQEAAMAAIGEYWLRYGYAVQRFSDMSAGLHVMDKFTYWKLRETYIQSSTVPESYKQAIRGIFEKGVTVWQNPADIGTIDISTNNPLPGVTL